METDFLLRSHDVLPTHRPGGTTKVERDAHGPNPRRRLRRRALVGKRPGADADVELGGDAQTFQFDAELFGVGGVAEHADLDVVAAAGGGAHGSGGRGQGFASGLDGNRGGSVGLGWRFGGFIGWRRRVATRSLPQLDSGCSRRVCRRPGPMSWAVFRRRRGGDSRGLAEGAGEPP